MTPEVRVEWRDEADRRDVWVFGEIDIASVGELERAVHSDRARLTVDLGSVTFMDLTGLRCLLDAADRYDEVVLIPSPRVERLLEVTASKHLFDVR